MDAKRIMFVINPAAGHGKAKAGWLAIEKALLNQGFNFERAYTEKPLQASLLTRSALQAGFNCIVAAGGDGTINEVLNGFYSDKGIINGEAVLAALPLGTGSDLSRMFSWGKDIETVKQLWREPPVTACDVIEASFSDKEGHTIHRYLLNISDVGLGAVAAYRVNQNSKFLGGFASFLLGTVSAIISHKNYELSIEVDGKEIFTGLSTMAVVANGKYFGGGIMIAPQARINDGELNVIILKGFSRPGLIRNLPLAYNGRHINHPAVIISQGKEAVIKSPVDIAVEMDGESPGFGSIFTYRLLHGAVKVSG